MKKLAKQAARGTIDGRKTSFIKPLSVFAGQKSAHLLDHHVIKWCKLFLNESQSAWRLPHREKGFYSAWRQLVEHDPALSRAERQRLNGWPEEPRDAMKKALRAFDISNADVQAYLEGSSAFSAGMGRDDALAFSAIAGRRRTAARVFGCPAFNGMDAY